MKTLLNFILESKIDGFVLLSGSDGGIEENYGINDLNDALTDAHDMSKMHKTSTFYVVKTINNEYASVDDDDWYEYCVFDSDAEDNEKLNKIVDNSGKTICYGSKTSCNDYLDGLTNGKINSGYYILPITTYEEDYLKENKIKHLV